MNDNLTTNASNEAESPAFLVGAVMRSCPFCGSNELHFFEEPSRDKTVTWHTIQHSATNPCSISMMDSNKDRLIKMWNARANVPVNLKNVKP